MQKVMIIGCPGGGKSVFAGKLQAITALPLYHLDAIWHRPDKTHISRAEFDMQLKKILQEDRWILDGNYQRTLEIRMRACDTVFLLDYPVEVCLAGAAARVGVKRADLPWVETEADAAFQRQILDFPKNRLSQIYALLEQYRAEKTIIIFKSREESDDYLRRIISES